MPKPGKTTLIFTKYHLFFCLQKHFFNTNWTYLAFLCTLWILTLHSQTPQTKFNLKCKPCWRSQGNDQDDHRCLPVLKLKERKNRYKRKNNASVFQFNISQHINDVIWNPSAEMKRVNMLSRSQRSILSSHFTSTPSPCCKERGTF